MKIAIAGGGTGGHLFPALAVGEALRGRGHEALIFISEKEVDALAITGRDDFRFERLPSVGMPRLFSWGMVTFFARFNASLAPCRRILAEFQPDAVLAMGGFTSTPPILAGKLRKIPTLVHESNAIPGKANRLNARLADAVLLGLAECRQRFPASIQAKCEVTGTPIRRSLQERVSKADALAFFAGEFAKENALESALHLDPSRTTLLVMGGSQGARGINEAMRAAAPLLGNSDKNPDVPGLQVIHLAGAGDGVIASLQAAYRAAGVPACVAPFCHRMELAYSAADLAIARSGAASLSELSHFALPSILIPYPHAAENHQLLNAEIFARAGAAALLSENAATGEALAGLIRQVTDADDLSSKRLTEMAANARSLAPQDAAATVAEAVLRAIERHPSNTHRKIS